jgi:hypothetical protein
MSIIATIMYKVTLTIEPIMLYTIVDIFREKGAKGFSNKI